MIAQRWKLKYLFLFLAVMVALFAVAQTVSAEPLKVRVQPSGETFAKAYVITGEMRTYFGNVEGGTPPYEYRWEFSNGGDTPFVPVTTPPRFISMGHVYDTFGTLWPLKARPP